MGFMEHEKRSRYFLQERSLVRDIEKVLHRGDVAMWRYKEGHKLWAS